MLKQLSAQDAQFLYTQTANNLTHIMGVYIYDPATAPGGFVRFKDIIRHVESRVDSSPLFKRRLHRLPFDMDHPYWVADEHFDIEAHMSHARLRSEEHTSELQSLMRTSYAVFCLKNKQQLF